MTQIKKPKLYDLEDRTFEYARSVRKFIKMLPKTLSNIEDGKQLIRSSGSVGANYIEANEALSKKDFSYRIKLCRKEAKESRYWIKLIDTGNLDTLEKFKHNLTQETTELMKIFGSIITKSQ
ncbi:MAG: four helix bundle protein [Deltaproteobacteria bacterium]|nr:four helix bundle protein [Deltaproteobacteria bacterium]